MDKTSITSLSSWAHLYHRVLKIQVSSPSQRCRLRFRGHQIIRTTDALSNVLIMKSCAAASATYLIS